MSSVASNIASGAVASLPKAGVVAAASLELAALLGGAGLVSYGAWLAWHPAGFLVGGALLLAGVILHQRGS